MPLGHPLIVVTGSKGGVGTTTVTAGLLLAAGERRARVAGLDLTGTNDLTGVLGRRAVSIFSVVRYRGRMHSALGRALGRGVALLGLDSEAAMYSDRLVEMVRLLCARRPVFADAGNAFAATGARPLLPYLALATHIVLVSIPDVRSARRTEHLLGRWTAHRDRITVVENMAGSAPAIPGAVLIPTARTGELGRLTRSPAGDAIRALEASLLPREAAGVKVEGTRPDKGIIRSLIARLPLAGRQTYRNRRSP